MVVRSAVLARWHDPDHLGEGHAVILGWGGRVGEQNDSTAVALGIAILIFLYS